MLFSKVAFYLLTIIFGFECQELASLHPDARSVCVCVCVCVCLSVCEYKSTLLACVLHKAVIPGSALSFINMLRKCA